MTGRRTGDDDDLMSGELGGGCNCSSQDSRDASPVALLIALLAPAALRRRLSRRRG